MASSNKLAFVPVYPVHHIQPGRRGSLNREEVRKIMAQGTENRENQERERRAKQRQEYLANHPLLRGQEPKTTGNSTIDTLNQVKHQLIREAVSLEHTRNDRDARGLDTSQLSTKIISAWKQVVATELDIKKQGVTILDPNSEEVQRIFKIWTDTMRAVMVEMVKADSLSVESMDLFFNQFSAAMEGWEGRLE